MKITYLGQAGLMLEKDGKIILIDPYLSNSVIKVNPANYRRKPVDGSFLKIKPDMIILTHDHVDHTDIETLDHYFTEGANITVLAGENAFFHVLPLYKGKGNFVLFKQHTQWSDYGLQFKSVFAMHSDTTAIGVIIKDADKTYYVTGDTLYNTDVIKDIDEKIDIVFLPVNGLGNNMNFEDAARFANDIGAKVAVPLHIGLFDNMTADDFNFENKVIPEFFKEIIF